MILPGNSIVQLAWVVNDLEEAAHRFSRIYGCGPFLMNRHIQLGNPCYRGEPVRTDFSTALAQAGEVQIELVEQHDDTPSVYRDLHPAGSEGFHHVAVLVPDVALEVERYRALGFATGVTGRFGTAEFAYVDTAPAIGHMIEILPDNDLLRGFFGAVRQAAETWDGSNPIREMG
jgi:catechol 2,3-dioxygenase-like lactoylglutathione lyase family enzyme